MDMKDKSVGTLDPQSRRFFMYSGVSTLSKMSFSFFLWLPSQVVKHNLVSLVTTQGIACDIT